MDRAFELGTPENRSGDMDRTSIKVPSHGPYQEPLLKMTVPTVIAGQVKHRRTTERMKTTVSNRKGGLY